MKVAVSSQGQNLDSPVDPRFGRARYFVVVETDTGEFSTHDNTRNVETVQGAGIQAGRAVVELGARAVLTGHVGPKAFAALRAAGLEVFTGVSGTVGEAVERYKAGQLQAAAGPNVEGHWT
ncbi:MAG TPA: dinitrogenase iron-molybdenum cofactor biosynthesis protein [Planctomycetaceae bacterium]|nr:dinitrogenase iron-molybdenum cofactor biosynthesis protein [Planctomycetaceae bacterium]